MKKLIPLILLFNAASVFAHGGGDRVGNGGDVIVCPDERTELLDIFQGGEDWGFIPMTKGNSRKEFLINTLTAFRPVDRDIADRFIDRSLEIEKEITLLERNPFYRSPLVKLTKNELVNISDEGVAELPAGCQIKQAATQISNPFPKEVKFSFQKKIWNSLDADVQASLILHEVIYEHMIQVGENSSRSTRYFNAALHAGALNSVKDYFDVSSLFEFRNIDINDDGKARQFGTSGNCKVIRKWTNYSENKNTGTTVIVHGRNVIQDELDFSRAMEQLWKKYVEKGKCD